MRKAAIILLTLLTAASLSAAQLVIPAAGSGPGANDSYWQSDVTIHNAGTTAAEITVSYHSLNGLVSSHDLTIAPRETRTIDDIVGTTFNRTGSGALTIDGDEFAVRKLSVTSRTFTTSDEGEFGQDIPAWPVTVAAAEGDTAVINGPADSALTRFNFGIYSIEETEVDWMVLRDDGTVAATVTVSYEAGVQVQYGQGISTLLGVQPEDDDVVYARIRSGRAFVFGSIIVNATNDPSFVPFTATRENFAAQLLGVDLNEDGVIDILDADSDGILDGEIQLSTLGYPNFFNLVVVDPEGNAVELQLVDASNEVRLLDNGKVQWVPSSSLRGSSGALKVQASDGFATSQFLIPVVYK